MKTMPSTFRASSGLDVVFVRWVDDGLEVGNLAPEVAYLVHDDARSPSGLHVGETALARGCQTRGKWWGPLPGRSRRSQVDRRRAGVSCMATRRGFQVGMQLQDPALQKQIDLDLTLVL